MAGKYARLNACFLPAGEVVKPRVYFRLKDPKAGAASYYVEMKSDMPSSASKLAARDATRCECCSAPGMPPAGIEPATRGLGNRCSIH